jgi:hypothetical protein
VDGKPGPHRGPSRSRRGILLFHSVAVACPENADSLGEPEIPTDVGELLDWNSVLAAYVLMGRILHGVPDFTRGSRFYIRSSRRGPVLSHGNGASVRFLAEFLLIPFY